ncbi:hypothetical protein [Actinomadura sp. 9N407]|uniref:AlkZ-related protein n=1 Tax=Actinomadura sp. 9N407 TaxID=3375154 RepID=UPI0037B17962
MGTVHEMRLERWGMDRPPLRTLDSAASFIDDVGFAVLFGDSEAAFPALREAARDDASPRLAAGWGEDLERMWSWKDELPVQGHAWVGRFVCGKQSLLSPRLLALLIGDTPSADALSPLGRKVAGRLEAEGPTSMRAIRQDYGLNSRTGQRLLDELGRALVVTNYGTVQDGPGWPSCVIELTGRAFPGRDGRPVAARRRAATRIFLGTVVEAGARELSRAFRWPRREATAVLDDLVERELAVPGAGGGYRLRA